MKRFSHIILCIALGLMTASCDYNSHTGVHLDEMEGGYSSLDDHAITEEVSSLNIDWVAGGINIIPTDDSIISVTETAKVELNDSTALRYKIEDNGQLRIQYCKPDTQFEVDKLNDLHKVLTVRVPRSLHLDSIYISGVGGDVIIDSVSCGKIDIDGVNFHTTAHLTSLPKEIDCDGVSQTLHLFAPKGSQIFAEADGVAATVSNELNCNRDQAQCHIHADGVKVKVAVKENK